jgi:hypothetical protein
MPARKAGAGIRVVIQSGVRGIAARMGLLTRDRA